MRRSFALALLLTLAATCRPGLARVPLSDVPLSDEVVDRIVVRIENDIIVLSEVRELAAYQQLVEGRAEPYDKLLSELIEQWMVNNEAATAHFPPAAESDVAREVAQLQGGFPSTDAYQQRLAELGITPQTVRRIVAQQIYLARYLDYKFRPAIQVDDAAIAAYYKQELAPQLAAKNQPVPSLADVSEQIREVLVQQGISARAEMWFEETKSRLKIEINAPPDAPVAHAPVADGSASAPAPGPSDAPAVAR
jgi:hypothetical protein